jgi:hypothetical protein
MKVSVFNGGRAAVLIGETWVDLQEVIVPGGGQSNTWHTLNSRGKYAGEILIEITFYDTRPKQEKASENMHQSVPNEVMDEAMHAVTRLGETRRRLKPGLYQHLGVTGPGEVAYCHECSNEWHSDILALLICPRCESTAIEIVSHNLEVAPPNWKGEK